MPVMSGRLRSSRISRQRAALTSPEPSLAQQVVERIGAVGEGHDLVVDAGAPDVALDQAGMAFVVLDHHDDHGTGVHGTSLTDCRWV